MEHFLQDNYRQQGNQQHHAPSSDQEHSAAWRFSGFIHEKIPPSLFYNETKWSVCTSALEWMSANYGKILPLGGMTERLKVTVLKTVVVKATVGSNPTPSADRHPGN